MTDKNIPIRTRMSALTFSIGHDQTMATAAARLRQQDIRHLPVLRGGRLIGILSDRDIALVESLAGVDPEEVKVEEAMTEEPYAVGPETPLGDVVEHMARHKYGATVVVDGDRPVGIFTTVDALLLARDLLS